MAYSNGGRIVTDGLVLSLDAADRNSLRSSPTVNLVLNPTLSGSNNSQTQAITSNWVFSGDDGPNGFRFYTGSIAGVTPLFPGEGMIGTTGPNAVPNNRRIYYTGGSQANTTYTLSFYYYMTGSLISGDIILINEYSSSTNVKSVYYPLTSASLNTWVRNETTFTTTTSSTGITNWGPVMSFSATTGLFMQRLQVEKSPYANEFVTGNRSLVWNDLSRNSNATLLSSSVSATIPKFNSLNENILNFDGTGSYATVTSTWSYLSSSALECVFKTNTISGFKTIFGYAHNEGYSAPTIGSIYLNGSALGASVITTTQVYRGVTASTTIDTNKFYHVVLNKDVSTGTLTIYVNGVLNGTQTFDSASYAQWPTLGNYIGSNVLDIGRSSNTSVAQGWSTSTLSGSIPLVRLYNRVLSASEVLQNYNAQKSRFGL